MDGLLPRTGLLSFFVRWEEDATRAAVLHVTDELLVARPPPEGVRKAPVRGIDFGARVELPPYSSRFVAVDDEARRPIRFDPFTGARARMGPPKVALPADAHERFFEVYEAWDAERVEPRHGSLGYDRAMEGEQLPDEVLLLRLDVGPSTRHDFLAWACLLFPIDRDALGRGELSRVRACYGASI